MAVEYELKFRATEAAQQAIYRAYEGRWETMSMETTYYDTADGALAARRFTLRRRLENGRSVCTVKTPAQGDARGEWETECDTIEAAIPVLCKLGGPEVLLSLTQAGVTAVCGARFTRQATQICSGDTVLELALDRGILFAQTRQEPLCEVEAELKSGSPEQVEAFAAVLAEAYGLQPEERSKFARARALREEQDDGAAE